MFTTIVTIVWSVIIYLAGHTKIMTRFLPVPAAVQDEEDLVKEFRKTLSARRKAAMAPALPPAPPPTPPAQ